MDHPNQNTMLLPASYAVISEEEMTYLDGGQSIYLGSAFNHDIYFNTDQFATFCQNAAINLFVLMTNYSFRYQNTHHSVISLFIYFPQQIQKTGTPSCTNRFPAKNHTFRLGYRLRKHQIQLKFCHSLIHLFFPEPKVKPAVMGFSPATGSATG